MLTYVVLKDNFTKWISSTQAIIKWDDIQPRYKWRSVNSTYLFSLQYEIQCYVKKNMGNPSKSLGRHSNAEASALKNAVTKGCTLSKIKLSQAQVKAFCQKSSERKEWYTVCYTTGDNYSAKLVFSPAFLAVKDICCPHPWKMGLNDQEPAQLCTAQTPSIT